MLCKKVPQDISGSQQEAFVSLAQRAKGWLGTLFFRVQGCVQVYFTCPYSRSWEEKPQLHREALLMTGKSSSKKSSQTTQAHLNAPVRHSALYFHCHTISQSESGPSWKLVSYGSIPYSQFSHGKCRKRRNNCKPTIQYNTEQFLLP